MVHKARKDVLRTVTFHPPISWDLIVNQDRIIVIHAGLILKRNKDGRLTPAAGQGVAVGGNKSEPPTTVKPAVASELQVVGGVAISPPLFPLTTTRRATAATAAAGTPELGYPGMILM
jgi:hypothetical protein